MGSPKKTRKSCERRGRRTRKGGGPNNTPIRNMNSELTGRPGESIECLEAFFKMLEAFG